MAIYSDAISRRSPPPPPPPPTICRHVYGYYVRGRRARFINMLTLMWPLLSTRSILWWITANMCAEHLWCWCLCVYGGLVFFYATNITRCLSVRRDLAFEFAFADCWQLIWYMIGLVFLWTGLLAALVSILCGTCTVTTHVFNYSAANVELNAIALSVISLWVQLQIAFVIDECYAIILFMMLLHYELVLEIILYGEY